MATVGRINVFSGVEAKNKPVSLQLGALLFLVRLSYWSAFSVTPEFVVYLKSRVH